MNQYERLEKFGCLYLHPDGSTRDYPPPITREQVDAILDIERLTPEERADLIDYWNRRAKEGSA